MNILIDTAIFSLQSQGGISRLWQSLIPALASDMPDATFDPSLAPDWFISTYYRPAPIGVKSLVMVYDLIVDKYPLVENRADSADIHRAVNEATAIVSISQQTAYDVKTRSGRDSIVAYPGVDPDFGKVKPSDVDHFRQFVGKPYVIVVGRRGGYKNVQTLYQAWGLWAEHNNYRLLCVGGEEMLPHDAAFDSRYPGTRLRMALNDYDLALAYSGATMLVYPSMMEGFGLPVIEAMACGCPAIYSPVMFEIADVDGLYCNELSPRSIANRLGAASDPAFLLDKGLAGIQRAKQFTWSSMASKIAEVLRTA